jgi:hypothetical protein
MGNSSSSPRARATGSPGLGAVIQDVSYDLKIDQVWVWVILITMIMVSISCSGSCFFIGSSSGSGK